MAVMLSCVEHRNSASNKDMHDQEVDHIPKRTYMDKSSFFYFLFQVADALLSSGEIEKNIIIFPWENVRKKHRRANSKLLDVSTFQVLQKVALKQTQ
jgi:hypothetical protein